MHKTKVNSTKNWDIFMDKNFLEHHFKDFTQSVKIIIVTEVHTIQSKNKIMLVRASIYQKDYNITPLRDYTKCQNCYLWINYMNS